MRQGCPPLAQSDRLSGDFSSGTFILLIDKSAAGLTEKIEGISLVEEDTVVGGSTLTAGDFLLVLNNQKNVYHWTPDSLGAASAGTESILIERISTPSF